MIRKLLPFLFTLTMLALPALAQVAPGTPVVPAVYNFAPRYSPDGKFIAYLRGNDAQHATELWVMDADGKNARRLLDGSRSSDLLTRIVVPSILTSFEWLPNSKSLISVAQTRTGGQDRWFYQVKMDGTKRFELNVHHWQFTGFTIAPNSKTAAFFYQNQYFLVPLDVKDEDLKNLKSIEIPDLVSSQPSWGVDGRIYFSAKGTKEENKYADIYAIEKDGKITQITDTKYADETSPSLSPDGKTLAFTRYYGLTLLDIASGKEKPVIFRKNYRDHSYGASTFKYRLLPDGRILATILLSESSLLPGPAPNDITFLSYVYVVTPDVDSIMLLTENDRPNTFNTVNLDMEKVFSLIGLPIPDISPDGKRLVYEKDGTLYLTDMPAKSA